jgi:hypothetical protein
VRLPADIVDVSFSSATSEIFVAGPGDRRTRRPARTAVVFILMSLGLTFGIEHVVMAAPADFSGRGALQVRGADASGRMTASSHVIDVSNAYPGMTAQRSTFEVRNTGDVPLTFTVTSTDLVVSGHRSLDDVLRITVRDRITGAVAYHGRLSGLRLVHHGALAIGSAATFTVGVTWPRGPGDDAYQDAGLTFSVVAVSSAA